MTTKHYEETAYVTADGNYSEEDNVLIFAREELTPEQWELLGGLHESDRYSFVQDVLADEDLSRWEP